MSQDRPRLPAKLAALPTRRLLELLLTRCEALARAWDDAAGRAHRLGELRRLLGALPDTGIATLPGVPAALLQVGPGLTLAQLTTLIVPLERALERRVRDEDFLPIHDDPAAEPDLMPVHVVADSLRSSFNVGGLFRSGECFGIAGLVLTGYSATPADPRVAKAAMGTDMVVPWRQRRRLAEAASELRAAGHQLLALETGSTHTPLGDLEPRFPCAVLVGNERFGLPLAVLETVDRVVRIPTHGRKSSLNVVSACSIALWELRRSWESRRVPAPGEATRSRSCRQPRRTRPSP